MTLKVEKLNALNHIVKHRRGYQNELNQFGKEAIESFKMVGFINTGHTLKADTYSTTKLADGYYKDLYGLTSYYTKRLSGLINKMLKTLI